ncbi:CC_3452 family protein [Phenylobacterium sp.]|uniref:CC_3452 family protein n=1 Tax=Phenylobacterium sp. TaxID=1871053 RepID=UPI003BAB5D5A
MKYAKALPLTVLLFLVFGAVGSRAAEPVVAKLRTAIEKKEKFIAAGTVFVCEQNQCIAAAPNYRTLSLEACKQISRRFGAVESIGDSRRSLDAEKLTTCNGSRS